MTAGTEVWLISSEAGAFAPYERASSDNCDIVQVQDCISMLFVFPHVSNYVI